MIASNADAHHENSNSAPASCRRNAAGHEVAQKGAEVRAVEVGVRLANVGGLDRRGVGSRGLARGRLEVVPRQVLEAIASEDGLHDRRERRPRRLGVGEALAIPVGAVGDARPAALGAVRAPPREAVLREDQLGVQERGLARRAHEFLGPADPGRAAPAW